MIFDTFSALKHSLCGAITTQPSELAWFKGAVECSICGIVMPLPARVLDTLRRQAVEAQGQMDELVPPGDRRRRSEDSHGAPKKAESPLHCSDSDGPQHIVSDKSAT